MFHLTQWPELVQVCTVLSGFYYLSEEGQKDLVYYLPCSIKWECTVTFTAFYIHSLICKPFLTHSCLRLSLTEHSLEYPDFPHTGRFYSRTMQWLISTQRDQSRAAITLSKKEIRWKVGVMATSNLEWSQADFLLQLPFHMTKGSWSDARHKSLH